MMKTEEFLKRLSDEEYVCFAGCIDRFKLSHIAFGKMRGDSRVVKRRHVNKMAHCLARFIRGGYADNHIFATVSH
jgi:hypothetical protein